MDKGYEVDLVDCIAKKMTTEDTVNCVKESGAQFVMGEITTPTCAHDYEVIEAIKAANPEKKIIIGGTHATVLSEQVMEKCSAIDVVVRQEYDFTIDEIMRNINDLSSVKGITYRDTKGKI